MSIIDIINDPFTWAGNGLAVWLGAFLPSGVATLILYVIEAALWGSFGLVMFMVMTWIERKGVARIQNRIGPNVAGPFGLLVPLADGIKALTKEDITPDSADKLIYNLSPIMAAVAALIVFAVIPFGPNIIGANINIGVFYILAVGGLGIMAVLLAGWSSNNKFSLMGGFRAVAQLISYDVPHILSVSAVVMLAGSLSLIDIIEAQRVWFILALPIPAMVSLLSGMAEVGRSPFDLLDAESEIIAGHHIEYSGMKFALFFLAEYIHALAVSALVTALFLGGWQGPNIFGITVPYLWFLLKTFLVFWIMVWARGTLPRLRIDQMMALNWKFFVPLSLVNLIVVAAADRLGRDVFGFSLASWPWTLVMFAFNMGLLLIALRMAGGAGRRARIAAENEGGTQDVDQEIADTQPAHAAHEEAAPASAH